MQIGISLGILIASFSWEIASIQNPECICYKIHVSCESHLHDISYYILFL